MNADCVSICLRFIEEFRLTCNSLSRCQKSPVDRVVSNNMRNSLVTLLYNKTMTGWDHHHITAHAMADIIDGVCNNLKQNNKNSPKYKIITQTGPALPRLANHESQIFFLFKHMFSLRATAQPFDHTAHKPFIKNINQKQKVNLIILRNYETAKWYYMSIYNNSAARVRARAHRALISVKNFQ